MIPGQLGPIKRVLFWVFSISVMRTMSVYSVSSPSPMALYLGHGFKLTSLGNTLGNTVKGKLGMVSSATGEGEAYQTARGISASRASSIPSAARLGLVAVSLVRMAHQEVADSYGTKIAEAVAPVSFTASLTFPKTGRSRCFVPALLGFVPPTTLVPMPL